jgi:hypothetical protein
MITHIRATRCHVLAERLERPATRVSDERSTTELSEHIVKQRDG